MADSDRGDALASMEGAGTEKPKSRLEKWKEGRAERQAQTKAEKSKGGGKSNLTRSAGSHGKGTPSGRGYPIFTESDIRGRIANLHAQYSNYRMGSEGVVNYNYSLRATATLRGANIGGAVLRTGRQGIEAVVINLGEDLPQSTIGYTITCWIGRGDRIAEVDLGVIPKDTTFKATPQTYDWMAYRVLEAMGQASHPELADKIYGVKEVLHQQYLRHYGKPMVVKAGGGAGSLLSKLNPFSKG